MTPLKRLGFAITAAALTAASASAQNLLFNGSFESYGGAGNSNFGYGLDGWEIGVTGGIDIAPYIGFENVSWQAQDGDVSVSLNWVGPEYISQAVTTTPGSNYLLTFYMAAEIYGGPIQRTLDVVWNGTTVSSASFDYLDQGPTTMGWQQFSVNVTGTGSDLLLFQSTTLGNYGPTLDNVSLVLAPVPEPETYACVAAGLLMGWGVWNRRRK